MGRPRGAKAKRPTSQSPKTEDADTGSGDDEAVVPAYKRGVGPQRQYTDEEDDGDIVKVDVTEDRDVAAAEASVPSNHDAASVEDGEKKRKRRRPNRGSSGSSATEEKDDEPAVRRVGFRHHSSRRKSTPRRAAEAGVECM